MLSDPLVILLTILGAVVTSIVGVVALGLRAIVHGQLIPGATHREIIKDRQEQIDTWKAAYYKAAEQRDHLMALGHTTVKAVTSVADAVTKGVEP